MCGEKLIWGGDHTYEESGYEGEGVVSNLSCPNDKCPVEVVFMHQGFSDIKINSMEQAADAEDPNYIDPIKQTVDDDTPKTIYIDDKPPSLSEMQELVGGYIEVIRPNSKLQIVVNEEGLLKNFRPNFEATKVWEDSGNYSERNFLVGNVIILTKKGIIRG